MIKQDQLWPGGFRFLFDDEIFKPGTDSFLLGRFPRLRRGERVCDLGAGTGLLGLLLLAREPDLQVTNVELQAAAVALAEQNTALNGLPERVSNLRADLREPGQLHKAGSFDLVVSNPPYFDAARGAVAQTESRGLARSDEACTLPQLCAAAGRLLRYGGRFCLVFRAERMPELFACLKGCGMEPKRLRLVQHDAVGAPGLVLLECRRGGKPGLRAEPTLLLYGPDGRETAEHRRAYFREEEQAL